MNLIFEPVETIGPNAVILRGFALAEEVVLRNDISEVARISPFRHMITPGGFTVSVAMTNCGGLGWVTDRTGYRYDPIDPLTGEPWPAMPASFLKLATSAADKAGFLNFEPDACLVNRYEPGTRLSLHQDR